MTPDSERSRPWSAAAVLARAALIALAAAWALWPAQRGHWLWDDGLEVFLNPLVRDPGGWWKAWVRPAGLDYFPLKDSMHWLEWRLWGGAPEGYHLANLALHVCGAWALWRVLAKLGVRLAWIGAFWFAVHPLAVESVAWIAEFKNVLSLPPLLLAFSAWIDFDAGRGRGAYARSLGWFVVAMACKSSVVMFPAVLLLHAWWSRRRIGRRGVLRTAPFFAVSLAFGSATIWFQWTRAMAGAGAAAVPSFGARLLQAGWNIAAYFTQAIVPIRLSAAYAPVGSPIAGALAWIGVGVAFVWLWSKREGWGRHALFGMGWFLLNLLPVLGLIPMAYLRVAPRADHFAYLSLAGICGLGAAALGLVRSGIPHPSAERKTGGGSGRPRPDAGLASVRRWPGGRVLEGIAAAAAALGLAWGARTYAAAFRSDAALWTRTVATTPDSWLARNNLGKVLLDEKRPGLAAEQLREAVRLRPDSGEARANLANALAASGDLAGAEEQYRKAERLEPKLAGLRYDLGRLLVEEGHYSDAADELRAALRLDPARAEARNMLGLALAHQGRFGEAEAQYEAALRLDPGLAEAYVNRANLAARAGRIAEAIALYRRALAERPDYAAAHRNLGTIYRSLGRDEEAAEQFDAAERGSDHPVPSGSGEAPGG